jgi:hypothetical protein
METISRNFSAGAVVTGNALDRAAQRLVLDAIRRLEHGSLIVGRAAAGSSTATPARRRRW